MAKKKKLDTSKSPTWDKLTFKQKKFVTNLFDTEGNATEAAVQAYGYHDNRNLAASTGSDNLRKPNISRTITELMESHNITHDRILNEIDKGLRKERGMTKYRYVKLGTNVLGLEKPTNISESKSITINYSGWEGEQGQKLNPPRPRGSKKPSKKGEG